MIWKQRMRRRRDRAEAPEESGSEADVLAQARLGRLTERSRLETDSYPEPPPLPPEPTGIRRLFWAPDELARG